MYYDYLESPVGKLLLVMKRNGLSHLLFSKPHYDIDIAPEWKRDPAALADVREQLNAYFAGARNDFDLPLAPEGTSFQQAVWRELLTIPYGETTSYGDIARRVADISAS